MLTAPEIINFNVLKLVRPFEISIFLCNNPKEIQLLKRLRLGLSHLQDHKFKHNFQVK